MKKKSKNKLTSGLQCIETIHPLKKDYGIAIHWAYVQVIFNLNPQLAKYVMAILRQKIILHGPMLSWLNTSSMSIVGY